MKKLFLLLCAVITLTTCNRPKTTQIETAMNNISQADCQRAADSIIATIPNVDTAMVRRGVENTARFWTAHDGTPDTFVCFCTAHFAPTPEDKQQRFATMQRNLETLYGYYNKISVELKQPLHVDGAPITAIDESFGMLDPFAHFSDDMFASKIAFDILLNFPFYTLEEKNTLGKKWTRLQWAYARMGDLFSARVPSAVMQEISRATTKADTYISAYNITMGNLRTVDGRKLFADSMNLISHWGLRDELKSNYADTANGLDKQRMIYNVMKHIVNQTIPEEVINSDKYLWYPDENRLTTVDGATVTATPEPNTRYAMMLANFAAQQAADRYNPTYPTYIHRAFDQQMEVSPAAIDSMFVQFIASPQVHEVAALITQRLARKLEPFDIWYDGFKARSDVNEALLSQITRRLYPNTQAYAAALPGVLQKLGFTTEQAATICALVQVDASRGAGHAWGAMMRGDKARLRTRVAANGMDYKGYNIAIHEFGHNVEQTLSLNNVDNYIMNGVPSTAFTEALAFIFQTRDLNLLDFHNDNANQQAFFTLDVFWGCYEIMGVALVDLHTWQWLYAHPKATAEELKNTVLHNATEIWNKYYAPILGEENSPILAIYSHMIDVPLYLPNYPYGHLVQFQLEQFLQGKNLAAEIMRIYPTGRLTPNAWMQNATGKPVSTQPLLDATEQAIKTIKDAEDIEKITAN